MTTDGHSCVYSIVGADYVRLVAPWKSATILRSALFSSVSSEGQDRLFPIAAGSGGGGRREEGEGGGKSREIRANPRSVLRRSRASRVLATPIGRSNVIGTGITGIRISETRQVGDLISRRRGESESESESHRARYIYIYIYLPKSASRRRDWMWHRGLPGPGCCLNDKYFVVKLLSRGMNVSICAGLIQSVSRASAKTRLHARPPR